MFLHIGENVVVPMKDIIGIFDIDSCLYSSDSNQFLRWSEDDGFVHRISDDRPKSIIVAEVEKKSRIYLSPISSRTLAKRTKIGFED